MDAPAALVGALAALAALVVALAAAALAVVPPASASAESAPGAIAGTVTDAATTAPLAEIEVCAVLPAPPVVSEEEEEETQPPPPSCSTTNASGEYTIDGLSPAGYFVLFNPNSLPSPSGPVFSTHNYVTQAYRNAYTEQTATTVAVAAGATSAHIDAALEEGGEIGGHVTAAADGTAIAGAFVCAIGSPGERLGEIGCAQSAAGGEYEILGLSPGGFMVLGFARGYGVAAYGAAPGAGAGTTVQVLKGQLTGSIDLALPPPTSEPPGVGGPGGEPEGAGGAGRGGSGPLAGTPGGSTALALRSRLLAVSRDGVAEVHLVCRSSGRCHGRVRLSAQVVRRRHGALETFRIPLGGSDFAIHAGAGATVRVRLDRRALGLLRAGRGRLAGTLAVILGPSTSRPFGLSVRLRA